MKKSAIVIDIYQSVLIIKRSYNAYFAEEMTEYEVAKTIGELCEYLVLNFIDSRTKHPAKLVDNYLRTTVENTYPFINDLIDQVEDGDIFPWVEMLDTFLCDDEYCIYTYNRTSFTLVIVKNDDWRAMEYEKIQLAIKGNQKDICLDEWTDKPDLVEQYLKTLRTPK